MTMPLPPARVSAMAPTRQSRASTPVYSARPPATPPITLSVRLRRSCGRGAGPGGGGGGHEPGGCSVAGGGAGGGGGGGQPLGPPGGGLAGGAEVRPLSLPRGRLPRYPGNPWTDPDPLAPGSGPGRPVEPGDDQGPG